MAGERVPRGASPPASGPASGAAEFYSKEAERLRTHVAQLESKLADFKRKHYGQLPELTEVNMSMMDRAESQLAQNETQMRSLRQERVFLGGPARAGPLAGPRGGKPACARRAVRAHAVEL